MTREHQREQRGHHTPLALHVDALSVYSTIYATCVNSLNGQSCSMGCPAYKRIVVQPRMIPIELGIPERHGVRRSCTRFDELMHYSLSNERQCYIIHTCSNGHARTRPARPFHPKLWRNTVHAGRHDYVLRDWGGGGWPGCSNAQEWDIAWPSNPLWFVGTVSDSARSRKL